GGNHEHVDGDDVAGVVLEEGGPSLRRGLGWPGSDAGQVAGDRALSDDVAEFEELSVDPGGAPDWVLLCHLPDKTSNLGPCRPAAGQRLPAPEEAERAAVPGDHGLRLDQHQGGFPAAPMTEEEGPESP